MKLKQIFPIFSGLLSILLLASPVRANQLTNELGYYTKAFYTDVDNGVRDQALKDELFRILSSAHHPGADGYDTLSNSCSNNDKSCVQHHSLGYRQARRMMYGKIDLITGANGQYAIRGVYCQNLFDNSDFPPGQGLGPMKIPSQNVLNTEHTWPQSRFSKRFPKDLQKSDLHILYPTSSHANSERGNLEMADVDKPTETVCPQAHVGFHRGDSGQQYFEPALAQKGNVARALFYFAVRYQMRIDPIEEESLRKWNNEDPVNEADRQRNEAVFKAQGDRNPFIDHPELANLISDF